MLRSLATKATRDAQSAVRETEAAGERAARQFQSETREVGRDNRPKENPKYSGEERRGPRSTALIEFDTKSEAQHSPAGPFPCVPLFFETVSPSANSTDGARVACVVESCIIPPEARHHDFHRNRSV